MGLSFDYTNFTVKGDNALKLVEVLSSLVKISTTKLNILDTGLKK